MYVEPLARQAVGLDNRVQKILTWRWKEVPVELGRQAVTCGQGSEGKDDNSIDSLQHRVSLDHLYLILM